MKTNNMVDHNKQHEWLMYTLALQTPPVAVKYLIDWNESSEWDFADKGYYRPKAPLNVCQFVGQARHHLRKVVATAEDQVCNIGALVTGAYPYDEDMEHGEIAKKDGVRKTPQRCERCSRPYHASPSVKSKPSPLPPYKKWTSSPIRSSSTVTPSKC